MIARGWYLLQVPTILLCAAAVQAVPNEWAFLSAHDTLDVLLKEKFMGSFIHTIAVDEKRSTISIEIHLAIGNNSPGTAAMELMERRSYDFDGKLLSIDQAMNGADGVSSWHLIKKENGEWRLSSIIGRTERVQSLKEITENLKVTAALYRGIRNHSIRLGYTAHDTMYDPMSGGKDDQEFRCSEEASPVNSGVWTFTVTSSILGREETWKIDTAGRTLYQEMFPFVVRKKTSRSGTTVSVPLFSLVEALSVPASRPAGVHESIRLVLDSSLVPDSSVRPFYRQNGTGWIVINATSAPSADTSAVAPKNETALQNFTIPTTTMQSDDARILKLADSLVRGRSGRIDSINACFRYVSDKLEKRYTPTFSNALETLLAGYGDCGEHAVLLGALLRAEHIPTRVVFGLVYVKERKGYYYHAWVMAYAGGSWIFVDPTLGVFPATRDRVPLVIDDTGTEIIRIAKLIGRITIDYVKTE